MARRGVLLAVGAVAVLIGAELGARALGPQLPAVARTADATTEVQLDQLEARRAVCTDVVAVGNSMARDAFDPGVFHEADAAGRTAYNASLDAATPAIVAPWLADHVLPATRPALVLLAVSSFDLNAANRAGAAADEAYAAARATRTDRLGAIDRALSAHLALVEHRQALRDPAVVWQSIGRTARDEPVVDAPPTAPIGPDGAGLSRRALLFSPDPVHDDLVRRQFLEDFAVDDGQLAALRTAIAEVRATGADVALAVLPVTPHFVDLHPAGAWDAYLAAMTAVADETATPLLRLDLEPLPPTAFADSHHLNATGSAQLAAELAPRLADAGVTARHC